MTCFFSGCTLLAFTTRSHFIGDKVWMQTGIQMEGLLNKSSHAEYPWSHLAASRIHTGTKISAHSANVRVESETDPKASIKPAWTAKYVLPNADVEFLKLIHPLSAQLHVQSAEALELLLIMSCREQSQEMWQPSIKIFIDITILFDTKKWEMTHKNKIPENI